MIRFFHIFIFIFLISFIFKTSIADEKIDKISKNLRCLICQGQSVYDSQSDFAISIKKLIKNKIESGENEDEIYRYLRIKYGEWILYEPEFNINTLLLWIFPLILFIFGGLLIFRKAIINKLNK